MTLRQDFTIDQAVSNEDGYLAILESILNNGYNKGDRTGTGTVSSFGELMSYDISNNHIPLLTTKQIFTKSFIHETLWFLSGSTDVAYLKKHGISIWDNWVEKGLPIYEDIPIEEIGLLKHIGASMLVTNTLDGYPATDEERANVRDGYVIVRRTEMQEEASEGSTHLAVLFEEELWNSFVDKALSGERLSDLACTVKVHQTAMRWLAEHLGLPTKRLVAGRVTEAYATIKDRVADIKSNSQYAGRLNEFFDKYAPLTDESGNIIVWAEDFTFAGKTRWLNKDGYDFLEDFLDKTGVPDRYIVAGSIGVAAYGKMWRDIDDTRMIRRDELSDHQKKGFVVAGHGAAGTPWAGKLAVTRKIDQIGDAIRLLEDTPDSRRIIVHAYDNRMVDFCSLPPCHSWFQFWTRELDRDERLSIMAERVPGWSDLPLSDETIDRMLDEDYNIPKRALRLFLAQRSGDTPVGIPFNLAQYSLLAHMVAHVTNMVAEEFLHLIIDAHIYNNQIELVGEQLDRVVIEDQDIRVVFDPEVKDIDDFTFESIRIDGYEKYHPSIPYPVAI